VYRSTNANYQFSALFKHPCLSWYSLKKVSFDEISAYWVAHPESDTSGIRNPEVGQYILEHAGETIDWLLDLGVQFNDTVMSNPNIISLPVIHSTKEGGKSFGQPLLDAATSAGAEILTNTPAIALIADPDDASGQIIGVTALDGGAPINIRARKGVVLTTGGYAANQTLIEALYPTFKDVMSRCAPSVTGDGLVMAAAHNAVAIRTGSCPSMEPAVNYDDGSVVVWDAVTAGGIVVNDEGRRFLASDVPHMNGGGGRFLQEQINRQQNPWYCLVLTMNPLMEMLVGPDGGSLLRADTVAGLAEQLGIPADNLEKTVSDFNGYCATGMDPDLS
jgi:succinate dehydrogenase/fumarate reductase flavoprotein subunit